MPDPRCNTCTSLLRWTGRRYYCGKCKTFPDGVAIPSPWRPIATAPADGRDLLLWWKGRGAGRGRWLCDESGEGWKLDGDQVIPARKYQGDCTHWMPLPPDPADGVPGTFNDQQEQPR